MLQKSRTLNNIDIYIYISFKIIIIINLCMYVYNILFKKTVGEPEIFN